MKNYKIITVKLKRIGDINNNKRKRFFLRLTCFPLFGSPRYFTLHDQPIAPQSKKTRGEIPRTNNRVIIII